MQRSYLILGFCGEFLITPYEGGNAGGALAPWKVVGRGEVAPDWSR